MNSIFVFVKLLDTIQPFVSSENMIFLSKIGFQTGNGCLVVVNYYLNFAATLF